VVRRALVGERESDEISHQRTLPQVREQVQQFPFANLREGGWAPYQPPR
jgi:hypothetical protein